MHFLEKEMITKYYKKRDYLNPKSNSIIYDLNLRLWNNLLNDYSFTKEIPYKYIQTLFNLHIPQKSIEEIYSNLNSVSNIDNLNSADVNKYTINDVVEKIKPRLVSIISNYESIYNKTYLEDKFKDSIIVMKKWQIFVYKNNKVIETLLFQSINLQDWNLIQEKLHYIWNARNDTVNHLWFTDSEWNILWYCSFSLLDRDYPLVAFDDEDITRDDVLNMTRAFSINWAPKNLMSSLYHHCYKLLQKEYPEKKYIITYINQNLLFEWSSFKGASYFPKGLSPMQYLYVDWIYSNRKSIKLSDVVKNNELECLPIVMLARWLTKWTNKELERLNWCSIKIIPKKMYLKW